METAYRLHLLYFYKLCFGSDGTSLKGNTVHDIIHHFALSFGDVATPPKRLSFIHHLQKNR